MSKLPKVEMSKLPKIEMSKIPNFETSISQVETSRDIVRLDES